jgi:hypothetical protein
MYLSWLSTDALTTQVHRVRAADGIAAEPQLALIQSYSLCAKFYLQGQAAPRVYCVITAYIPPEIRMLERRWRN